MQKEIILRKHANTRHAVLTTEDEDNETLECESEGSLCDNRFKTTEEFINHMHMHMNEIEAIDLNFLEKRAWDFHMKHLQVWIIGWQGN